MQLRVPQSFDGRQSGSDQRYAPYSVAVGNPARAIKFRFPSQQIERLLRLAWWDWPDEKVRSNVEWFYRPVQEFLNHFERTTEAL